MVLAAQLGAMVYACINDFGDFCRFCGRTLSQVPAAAMHKQHYRSLLVQLFEVGTRSIPVVMITGAFVGAVLAVQTVSQFKAIGMIDQMGTIVNMSVLRELGPVLATGPLAPQDGCGRVHESWKQAGGNHEIDALEYVPAGDRRRFVGWLWQSVEGKERSRRSWYDDRDAE